MNIKRELNTIVAVTAREISTALKTPGMLIMSLAMPIVMMGMLGGNMMQNMASGLNFNLGMFMLVGMMIQMLFLVTSNGVASLVDDHDSHFSEAMLVAPVSRYSIVIGKTLGSGFAAIISMLGVVIVGIFMGITISVSQFLLILILSPLICLAAGSVAMIFIGFIQNKKIANAVIMMLVMGQMFLSGAIIPINNTKGILKWISRVLPMTYCLDLARSVVYRGTEEYTNVVMFNPSVTLFAIVVLTIVFLSIGTFFYARSEKNK
ncbi:MAG: ABC transporter permease [Clostridioides sp.]|jgi:ABC-2 type transport system permease protein|nr:ABC transporter permease [Clostridioides sp.]